ncbi:hypothetical protein J4E85_002363 [Alternaria conjuncta]|uniref:uncharacterized protein n=1 Tax=Alternaria conjuncta TaxID=181017 RepID=UPI00221EE6F9|nr:uncharacterized protein J4E85_002363 [Alternaria conjuncta]KAI4934506.1 hypothetical protein J4E85_002363 [Alternaria conjuncta]
MADLTQPIVPAPDDYVVDLENPQRRGELIILWIGIVGTVISTFLLAVRAYTKVVLVKKLSSDDYCLLLAWITLTTTVLYSPALAFAKLSFLCLYLNLSPARSFRAGVYFTIFVVVGSCVGIVISLLAACEPFAKNIDVTVTEGQCLNKAALYIATGVLNIITDIMVIILPIPMVLRLHMSKERKIMVMGIFGVGSM